MAVLILLVAALVAGAFDGLLAGRPGPLCEVAGAISECGTAEGVVIAVEGPSLAIVERFSLRTAAGEVLQFEVERLELAGGGKPAPHLREHQLDGAPIAVEYKRENGRLVALRYVDAP